MSEGLTLAAGGKSGASEFFSDRGYWPPSNASAGLAAPSSIVGNAVKRVSLYSEDGKGYILIEYNAKVADGAKVLLIGSASDDAGSIEWNCKSENAARLLEKWLPARCRS
ncbi:MAG: pilin [Zoogloeaceae bacterium]|nr:pilin [Zoogloeaceae bacterium]